MNRNVDSTEDWAAPLGGVLVALLLICFALVAAGGWKWFADFLTSSASGWAQAIGAILAIYVTARIAGRDQRKRDENSLIVAEFTAAKISGLLEPFSLQTGELAEKCRQYGKFDCDPKNFAKLLTEVQRITIDVTEEQLLRLAPVDKQITHDVIDAIVLFKNVVTALTALTNNPERIAESANRRETATFLAAYFLKSHQLSESARIALLRFLKLRGVTVHELDKA